MIGVVSFLLQIVISIFALILAIFYPTRSDVLMLPFAALCVVISAMMLMAGGKRR